MPRADHPSYVGPIGVTGWDHANRLAAEADVVLAVGTRLQDFTTGSWTVFGEGTALVALNAARFDATKHLALALVADARDGLAELEGESGAGGPTRSGRPGVARRQRPSARFVAERTRPGDGEPRMPRWSAPSTASPAPTTTPSRRRAASPAS